MHHPRVVSSLAELRLPRALRRLGWEVQIWKIWKSLPWCFLEVWSFGSSFFLVQWGVIGVNARKSYKRIRNRFIIYWGVCCWMRSGVEFWEIVVVLGGLGTVLVRDNLWSEIRDDELKVDWDLLVWVLIDSELLCRNVEFISVLSAIVSP